MPQSHITRLIRALACAFLAPFVLAIVYTLLVFAAGALWLCLGALGDPAALIPYACIVFTFLVIWSCWEIQRNRKLYRKYMSEQPKDELETVVLAPAGNFTKFDRKIAADVLYSDQSNAAI